MSMTSFFVEDKKLTAEPSSIIKGSNYRITVLSDILVRMEYDESGEFEDRATSRVICRRFDKVNYDVVESETLIQIKTVYFTLTYAKGKPFNIANLKVMLNESNFEWTYQSKEVRNFGAISYSLDNHSGPINLSRGLYSSDGMASIDDSNTYVIGDNNEFVYKNKKSVDVYLFVYRRDFGKCLHDYYKLCGSPSFIPRYALGNWWYKNDDYSMKEIGDIVSKFYENNIPISTFLLGEGWHNDKNVYKFREDTFPNLDTLKDFMKANNIKFGVTISPQLGINSEDEFYSEAQEKINVNSKNIPLIPFNLTSSNFYFNKYIKRLNSQGVEVFSLDYNNPNNIYNLWLLNHYHYVNNPSNNNKRGLILSRNSMICPHRYPVTYSGHTKVNWQTFAELPFYNLSAANIGVSFVAHPIGGYSNGIEDSELYMRYIQFGVFSPILIMASAKGKYYKREPWRWSKLTLDVIGEYLRLRHRLIPYLYTESYLYYKTGVPLIQPLYYSYPKIYDEPLYRNEYFLGTQFLISPIIKKKNPVMNRVVQRMFIPEGIWYDFRSGKKYPGNKYYMSFYKDEDYPAFCKEGSIIPMSLDYHTKAPNNMEVQVFPGVDNTYIMYEDDGNSLGYKTGDYLITKFELSSQKDNYTLKISKHEGRSNSIVNNRNYKIVFRNTRHCIVSANVDNKEVETYCYTDRNDFVVEIKNISITGNLVVNCTGNDIEINAINLINDDIANILDDLEIETSLKEKIDEILFSNLSIKKKRIEIKKLKKYKLELKFEKMFINLLEYIDQV